MSAALALPADAEATLKATAADRMAQAAIVAVALLLLAFLAAPLAAIGLQAVQDKDGRFIALANFISYAQTPALLESLWNSVWVSATVTLVTVPMAFVFAYALTRSRMRWKALLRGITLLPLLAPSLLSAISLIYWFGNQGVFKGLLTALGTTAARKFLTITLPGAKYGLISAALVVFTLVVTDFGIPKVIGGNFNVLATDVFKLVIGQQDFQRGAVVAVLLLAPAVLTFAVDHLVGRRHTAMLSARAVPYRAKRAPGFDRLMTLYCGLVAALVLAMIGMAVFASFASFWPYNLQPSLRHYAMGLMDAEVGEGFVNSLKMATGTAVFGTALVFVGAYLLEKTQRAPLLRGSVRLLAMLPMAVPGLVLGLGYIFFFNEPGNPLNALYHTMTLLTLCTIVHFYTTGHLTAVTALKALDPEFEAVSASLKVPFYKTFWRVTLPLCTPALIDIARYFFVNAMTTISAVVFLYSPETKVASIAILNLDEAGEIGAAAACAVLIALASTIATLLFWLLARLVERRNSAWKE